MNTQVSEQGNALTSGKKKQVTFMTIYNFAIYMRWFVGELNKIKLRTTLEKLDKSPEARAKMRELHQCLLKIEKELFGNDGAVFRSCSCDLCTGSK